jgi:hypothetical protein
MGLDMEDCFHTTMPLKGSTYEGVNVDQVAQMQTHLTTGQQIKLKKLLSQFSHLFRGKLGSYPHHKMHLHVDRNDLRKLKYQRPYPIPKVNYEDLFLQELDYLVKLGVLSPVNGLVDFAAPTFLVPKPNGTSRWVSNFRAINKIIQRKVYPLPKINDLLKKRSGYSFFTKLDISMQFFTFELDEESKDLCIISTPKGNY